MIRAVLDTNVIISSFLQPGGPPGKIRRAHMEGRFDICSSLPLIEEVSSVLRRPVIQRRYSVKVEEIEEFLRILIHYCCFKVEIGSEIDPFPIADPDDMKVLQAALAANSDYIVSGDHHLLDLRRFRGIPIVTPREFLEMLPQD